MLSSRGLLSGLKRLRVSPNERCRAYMAGCVGACGNRCREYLFYAIEEYACDKGEVRYSGDLISGCFPADSPVVLNGR